jgi:hypothetical protein
MRKFALVLVCVALAGCSRSKEKQLVAEQAAISSTISKHKAALTPVQKDQFIEATAQGWYSLYLLQGGKPRAQPVLESTVAAPAPAVTPKAIPAKAEAQTEKKYDGK